MSAQELRRQLAALHEEIGRALDTALEQHAPWEMVENLIEARSRLDSRILSDSARRPAVWMQEAAADVRAAERVLSDLGAWLLEVSAGSNARR